MASDNQNAEGDRELLPTRRSLLGRLRDWEDQDSWRDFFNTYWKFIYGVARRSGLSDQEAEDVVQETVLSVVKKMPEFVYDPAKCSFKGWLMFLTRRRIIDQFRRRQQASGAASADGTGEAAAWIENLPDPGDSESLETQWDAEWERNLLNAAMERVQLRVQPAHFQIFQLSAVKGLRPREIARLLQVSAGQVYIVRHRLTKEVKQEVENLKNHPWKEQGAKR